MGVSMRDLAVTRPSMEEGLATAEQEAETCELAAGGVRATCMVMSLSEQGV